MRSFVLLALPVTLLAQPARPTVGPIDTGRTVFRIDTMLPNGLRITLAHVGRSPKALVRVVLSNACGLDITSSGDSVGHMGGSLTVSSLPERIDVSADVLRDFVAPTIALIAPRVRTARFDSTSTAGTSVSADAVGMRALRDAFTSHPRAASGCLPVGPSRTRVLVAGIFSDRAALNAITRAFGDWPDDSVEMLAHPDQAATLKRPALIVIHRPGAKQSALLVGSLVPEPANPDYAPLRVADAILGANVVSRITMNIREAKGYAYAPTSILTTAPSGTSTWVEIADVSTGVTAPALHEILAEISRLGAEEPAATEVEGAQRYLLGRFLVETATRTGWSDVNDLPSAASDTRRLVGVTASDVRRSVATWLAPSRLTIVVVGDTTALGDQMAAIHSMADRIR
jgi:hypothetical protein